MGMTAFEKILARAAGVDSVKPGDVVHPVADLMFLHDGQVEASRRDLDEIGIDRLWDPQRVVFVTDHEVVYATPRAAQRGVRIRETAKAWQIGHFYDVGQGGHGHIFPMEKGMVGPGMFIFANDMHCTNFGAIGAVALRAGGEIMSVLATGTLWTLLPTSVRITIKGQLRPGVYARDVGFKLARELSEGTFGVDATYRVIELAGDLEQFGLAERIALCNSPTEVGAVNVFIPPTPAIIEHVERIAGRTFAPAYSDADAVYEAEGTIDASTLEPQVALPGGVERSVDVSSVAGQPVVYAYIGSCGSGSYEDLVVAADILRGRRVADGVRLLVVPGTVDTARRLHTDGLLSVFQDAGAMVLPSGCGPCSGGNMGPLGPGEVAITTGATNSTGRMGPRDSEIYLASPATVTASAIAGKICDARAVMA